MIRNACKPFVLLLVFAVCAAPQVHSQTTAHVAATATTTNAGTPADTANNDEDEAPDLIAVGDFNRDGIPDVAKVNISAGDQEAPRMLTLLLGEPNGAFKEMLSHPVLGPDPKSIVIGDFNADGIPDLIVGDGDGALTEFLGDGTGNMVSAGEIAHLGSVFSIAIGDFNHDGIPDLAVSDSGANALTVFLGTGKAAFRAVWSMDLPMPGTVYRISIADFNGDGLPDLALTTKDDAFKILLGHGDGTFTDAPALSNVKDPNSHCPT